MNEYNDYFFIDNNSGKKCKEKFLSKNNPELYNKILDYSEKHSLNEYFFLEKIWFFINNVSSKPNCFECGGCVSFTGDLREGYSKFCSTRCSMKNLEIKEKIKDTCILKYNVEHPAKSSIVRDKYIQTCLKKYGFKNTMCVDEINLNFNNNKIINIEDII